MANLKPYPAYKDSGVDWLGELPEGWEVRRQGRVAELCVSNVDKHVVEGEIPVRLCNYVDVYKNDRIRAGMTFSVGTAQRSEVNRFRLRIGDVLITKDSEMWDDIASPALVEDEADDLVCGYHLAILRPRSGLSGAYLFRASQSTEIASQYHVSANGVTRFGLTHGVIKRIAIPLPPLADQAAIACFLDHVDSRIQRLIAAKERLIELLEEEKQAVIHRAVTRGLDPDAPLKPSGVDWLRDVPSHWTVTRVKNEFLCLNYKRRPLSSTERGLMERRYDYYGASGVIDRVTDYLFDDDLLLVAEDGANLVLRNLPLAIIARGRYWVNNHAHILKPRNGDLEFTAHLMESLDYRPYISGAAQPKLTQDRLLSVPIVVPPPDQQREIRQELQVVTRHIDATIDTARRHITLLREFRTRLISDVVTGKLDVREAAERLPDDPDAADPALDEQLEEVVA